MPVPNAEILAAFQMATASAMVGFMARTQVRLRAIIALSNAHCQRIVIAQMDGRDVVRLVRGWFLDSWGGLRGWHTYDQHYDTNR